MGKSKTKQCALCQDDDPTACFAVTHGLNVTSFALVNKAGGPCQCSCHDEDFEDEE